MHNNAAVHPYPIALVHSKMKFVSLLIHHNVTNPI